jgi:phosphoribosyl 1,2-cyclic phosphodiesterase
MPDTTMDRFSEKQKKIDQRRINASALYPALWSHMIEEWRQPDPQDRVWLTYSANYLFRSNDVRWAIDPLTLDGRFEQAPRVNAERDLRGLSFVLLTHDHKDHLDLGLLYALRNLPLPWVVPEPLLSKVMLQAGLPRENIIVPSPLSPIVFKGFRILPFDGLHWETTPQGDIKGVPATGYLIESNGKRWLFPGDTRTYDTSRLPAMGPVDVIFSHLWLGRGAALQEEPPLLDAFCHFFLNLNPRKLILTHLNELGRDANDYWDQLHVQKVRSKFRELSVNFPISHHVMGESIQL